jgi:hypothetical protein
MVFTVKITQDGVRNIGPKPLRFCGRRGDITSKGLPGITISLKLVRKRPRDFTRSHQRLG